MVATKAAPRPAGSSALIVNADATGGSLAAQLCRADGSVIDAFSRDRCLPLQGDELDGRLAWRNADPADLPDTVKIRFLLNGARLYSYRWQ